MSLKYGIKEVDNNYYILDLNKKTTLKIKLEFEKLLFDLYNHRFNSIFNKLIMDMYQIIFDINVRISVYTLNDNRSIYIRFKNIECSVKHTNCIYGLIYCNEVKFLDSLWVQMNYEYT